MDSGRTLPKELRFSWVALLLALCAGVLGTILMQNAFPSDETKERRVAEPTTDDLFARPRTTLPLVTTTTAPPGAPSLVISPHVAADDALTRVHVDRRR